MTTRGKLAWGLILFLGIIHFDFWFWDNDTLLFGFVPVALAFHAGISISAALAWALVVQWDWPAELEDWANEVSSGDPGGGQGGDDDVAH